MSQAHFNSMCPSTFALALACAYGANSADVEVVAVGAEVWKLAGDDAYTGSTFMDFVLYQKQTVIEESLIVGDNCPEEVLRSNRSDFSLKLMNARGSPNIENNAALGTECPKGAQLPAPAQNFWCRSIAATLSYDIDTNAFPFDYQDFRIDLQDDGAATKRRFCYLDWLSEKPMFDKDVWSTPPEFKFQQGSQCYPPCTSDLQRRSKCSFIWRTKRSWRKAIYRYCVVPLGVVILCVAVLTVPGAKDRLTAAVGLIWTINSYYGTVHVLSLRSKKIGIFENFVGWNYLVVLVVIIESLYWMWTHRQKTAAASVAPDVEAAGVVAVPSTEAAKAAKAAEAKAEQAVADRFRDKLDLVIRCLILIFTVLQVIAVAFIANGILSDFLRSCLFWLQIFFLFCVGLSVILLKCSWITLMSILQILAKGRPPVDVRDVHQELGQAIWMNYNDVMGTSL